MQLLPDQVKWTSAVSREEFSQVSRSSDTIVLHWREVQQLQSAELILVHLT